MGRQEALNQYAYALSLGKKEYKERVNRGKNPHPAILDELIDETAAEVAKFRDCDAATAKAHMLQAISLQEEVEPTVELIKELKAKGYKLYVLSNMSKEYIEYLRKLPVFEYFDYQAVSCEQHLGKPDHKFYEYLLSHCNLVPSETIFIDDRKDNVEAAAELGIVPFHFDRRNPEKACEELRKVIYNE